MAGIRIKRGTRAQIDAAAAASQLVAGEPYLVTDEARIGIATAANAWTAMQKMGEGGGGSVINSIQRGTVAATINSTGTVTVSAVDPAKSVLHINVKSGNRVQTAWGDESPVMASMKIVNGTTLEWAGGVVSNLTSAANPVIEWQLVEYL